MKQEKSNKYLLVDINYGAEIIIMQNNTTFINIEPNYEHNESTLFSIYIQLFLNEYGYYDNELFDEDNFNISVGEM